MLSLCCALRFTFRRHTYTGNAHSAHLTGKLSRWCDASFTQPFECTFEYCFPLVHIGNVTAVLISINKLTTGEARGESLRRKMTCYANRDSFLRSINGASLMTRLGLVLDFVATKAKDKEIFHPQHVWSCNVRLCE